VAGAGIGGMTAALLLARAGAEVTLVERVAEPGTVGAGILLQPNGLGVLYALGLGEGLRRAAFQPGGSGAIRDEQGRPIMAVDLPDFGDGLDHVLGLHRAHLYGVLLAAVHDQAGIELRTATEVTGAGPEGTLSVRGPDGPATIAAELVVGADGARSVVRSAGDFRARVQPTGRSYLRAVVPGSDLGVEGEWWTRLGLFGGVSLGDGTTYVFADISAPPVAAAMARRDPAAVAAAWGEVLPVAGQGLGRVAEFDDLLVNEVVSVHCGRWVDGRLALLGDAAHAMPPNLGQGANSAVTDAAVLALELDAALAADGGAAGWAAGLERYQARRRPAVRRVQRVAELLARLSNLTGPAGRRLRDSGLRLAGRAGDGADRVRTVQQEDPARLASAVRALTTAPAP
jgi:2-polyprenyl-6-methoxyphenol hydroxylase-like FAD-dependent oxidoreductase